MSLISNTCNDNGSGMPRVTAIGLTSGSMIWIRVWENGNKNNAAFGICATIPLPPPGSNPDEPCGATLLTTPTTTCNYISTTTVGATITTIVATATCITTQRADIWVKCGTHRIEMFIVFGYTASIV